MSFLGYIILAQNIKMKDKIIKIIRNLLKLKSI